MLRALREFVLRAAIVLALGTCGMTAGILVEFPNLVTAMFRPQAGTGAGVLAGWCVGTMMGLVIVGVRAWNWAHSD